MPTYLIHKGLILWFDSRPVHGNMTRGLTKGSLQVHPTDIDRSGHKVLLGHDRNIHMFSCIHTIVLVLVHCQERAAAHLESGGDIKVLLHVSAQHLADTALADLLVVKGGVCLSLCTNKVSAGVPQHSL